MARGTTAASEITARGKEPLLNALQSNAVQPTFQRRKLIFSFQALVGFLAEALPSATLKHAVGRTQVAAVSLLRHWPGFLSFVARFVSQ